MGIGHLGKSGNFRAKTLLGGHSVSSTHENRLGNIGKVGHLGIFWAVGQMPTGENHERGQPLEDVLKFSTARLMTIRSLSDLDWEIEI